MNGPMCKKCHGVCVLVTGALILINAWLWPKWLGVDGWVTFAGVLMVLCGFMALVVPNKCRACNGMPQEMKPVKGKK